jgi:Holliday junction resolvase YEN1
LLQREGIVDAVLSEDVDTLMFGSGLTFRSWTPEAAKSKVPTHVNLYDASITKETSGMDREGMILVALMSGGDYVPEGIPGCGPKTACEAARAGFGQELCRISRRDKPALRAWKDRLAYELHTNDSKHFNRKHGKLNIPDDFPNPEVLGYYTHPVLSSSEKLEKLRRELRWDMGIDFKELRTFTGDAFDWTKLGGAKKFIRNLAPALLVRGLRMRAEGLVKHPARNVSAAQKDDELYVKSIHGKRNHGSTDGVTELRITFTPHELVPIDLDTEEPDDDINQDSSDDEGNVVADLETPGSPSKKRAPSSYDPTQSEKLWVFETYVKAGAPITMKEWEDRAKNARILVETRNANRGAKRAEKEKAQAAKGGMQKGALDRYAKVAGSGIPSSSAPPAMSSSQPSSSRAAHRAPRSSQPAKPAQKTSSIQNFARVTKPGASTTAPKSSQDLPPGTQTHRWLGGGRLEVFRSPEPRPSSSQIETIDLLSSPLPTQASAIDDQLSPIEPFSDAPELLPSTVTKRRRSPLRRWATDTAVLDMTATESRSTMRTLGSANLPPSSPCSLPSPSQYMPAAKKSKPATKKISSQAQASTPKRTRTLHVQEPISLLSSSPGRQTNLFDYFSPRRRAAQKKRLEPIDDSPMAINLPKQNELDTVNLTGSPTPKAKRRELSNLPRKAPDLTKETSHAEETVVAPQKPVSINQLHEPTSSHYVGVMSLNLTWDEPVPPVPAVPAVQKIKQIYRIRDSLPGAFAIEELDMTKDVGREAVKIPKKGKTFRKSEVSVLDLTGT